MTFGAAELVGAIESLGWRGRVVPVSRLADLVDAVRGRHGRGLIAEEAYRWMLRYLSFDLPADLPAARSLVVVSVPSPPVRIGFQRPGGRVEVVVPPTYVREGARAERVLSALADRLRGAGHSLVRARVPLKTLAVRSGLARYGRNNICYVPGMGSFAQLVGAYTDVPCDGGEWRESEALERCDTCVACLRRCPTGAIGEDRFALHGERCITAYNECAGELPGWIDPSWHHCLVGCMRCQEVCPENREVLGRTEDGPEFTEEETALLAERVPFERLPEGTAAKWRDLGIAEDYGPLCRNLALLLSRSGAAG